MNNDSGRHELAEEAAALLAEFSEHDPVVILLQQQRVALCGPMPWQALDEPALEHRNLRLRTLIGHATLYRKQLAQGVAGQAQAAARAVCGAIDRLLHDKAARCAALQSPDDALLSSRLIVSADVARRVRASPESFKAIGPTAILVNWLRSLDETIPYGRQLVGVVAATALMAEHRIGYRESVALGVLFQARYRAINRALTALDPAQVIELAAGLSPRGLHLTRDYPALVYIESDLPDVTAEKVAAVNAIVQGAGKPGGFMRFEAVDASNCLEVLTLLERLRDDQKTAIISEGLLVYLDRTELVDLFATMRQALRGSDRVWIADIVTQENLWRMFADHPRVAEAVRSVFRSTNRHIVRDNPFLDDQAVATFIAEQGLHVVSTMPLADLVREGKVWSPVKTWHEEMVRLVGDRKIWVMQHGGRHYVQ